MKVLISKFIAGIVSLLFVSACTESTGQKSLVADTLSESVSVPSGAETLALVGGTLLDGLGGTPVVDSVVVIQDGLITCAGSRKTCSRPISAKIVSTKGKWVTPGLVDSHVHFSQTGWVDARSDLINVRDLYPYEEVIATNRNNPERYYRSYLCSGVTAVFDVGGYPWAWSLRKAAEDNPFAPHIAATGPLVANFSPPGSGTIAEQVFLSLDSTEAGENAVRYMVANKADAIKLYYIPDSPENLEAFHGYVRSFAKDAQAAGIRFVTHAQSYDGARFAVESGTSMLVHSVGDRAIDDEFIALMKSGDVVYSPTLSVHEGYVELAKAISDAREPAIDDPNQCVDAETLRRIRTSANLGEYVTEYSGLYNDWDSDTAENWKRSNLVRLANAGITVATATDAGNPLTLHGPAINGEMEAMQEAGLTPMQVLVASTRNGAIALGREDDIGTVEAGKIADLLIVAADPVSDIRNMRQLESVIRAGHLHSQASLRAR